MLNQFLISLFHLFIFMVYFQNFTDITCYRSNSFLTDNAAIAPSPTAVVI